MKNSCLLAVLLLFSSSLMAQKDSVKTAKSGYEMKQYWFVMLVAGKDKDKIKDEATIKQLQAGHMANMQKLAEMGKLLLAGPFGDKGNWRGLFILNCASRDEAEGLLKTDPAIAAGRLDYELKPWWTAKQTVVFE